MRKCACVRVCVCVGSLRNVCVELCTDLELLTGVRNCGAKFYNEKKIKTKIK